MGDQGEDAHEQHEDGGAVLGVAVQLAGDPDQPQQAGGLQEADQGGGLRRDTQGSVERKAVTRAFSLLATRGRLLWFY